MKPELDTRLSLRELLDACERIADADRRAVTMLHVTRAARLAIDSRKAKAEG